MKTCKLTLLITLLATILFQHDAFAQRRPIEGLKPATGSDYFFGLKIYPGALLSGKLSLQAEVMLSERSSITLDFSRRNVSFSSGLAKTVAENLLDSLNTATGGFTSLQLAPSIRFYGRKKGAPRGLADAPRGFYFSPGLRYIHSNLDVSPQVDGFSGVNADLTTSMYGLNLDIGIQGLIANRISIDWNIIGLGGQYGSVTAGVSAASLSNADAQELANELNQSVDEIPFVNLTFEAIDNGVSAKNNIFLPVLRSRLSLGVFF